MKYKCDVDFSLMGYLHSAWYADDATDRQQILESLGYFQQLCNAPYSLLPIFFIIDYSNGQYMTFTDSIRYILGYDAREPLEGGIQFAFHIGQQDYINTVSKQVFPKTVQFLQNTPQAEHRNCVFTFNNRMKSSEGKWVDILQKSIYLTSQKTGMPLYCIGLITDISLFKTDNSIVYVIEKKEPDTGLLRVVGKSHFYPFGEDILLTRQEKNIVNFIADGFSSKMIADKLNIAENTVLNHRKNMLRKTNSSNVAQLVAYVIRNNIV